MQFLDVILFFNAIFRWNSLFSCDFWAKFAFFVQFFVKFVFFFNYMPLLKFAFLLWIFVEIVFLTPFRNFVLSGILWWNLKKKKFPYPLTKFMFFLGFFDEIWDFLCWPYAKIYDFWYPNFQNRLIFWFFGTECLTFSENSKTTPAFWCLFKLQKLQFNKL